MAPMVSRGLDRRGDGNQPGDGLAMLGDGKSSPLATRSRSPWC